MSHNFGRSSTLRGPGGVPPNDGGMYTPAAMASGSTGCAEGEGDDEREFVKDPRSAASASASALVAGTRLADWGESTDTPFLFLPDPTDPLAMESLVALSPFA